MIIRLDRIEEEPYEWSEQTSVPLESLDREDLLELAEVRWSGRVAQAPPGYRFQAHLSYRQTLGCNRCLSPVAQTVESDLELIVVVRPPLAVEPEVELSEEDLGVLAIEDERLDTEPILLEQLQLNLPMSVLCRPDCAGLCPVCGANRNEAPCECRPATDPRWEALRKLASEDR